MLSIYSSCSNVFANRVAQRKSVVLLARVIVSFSQFVLSWRCARLLLACNSENERTASAFGDYKTNCREFEDNPQRKRRTDSGTSFCVRSFPRRGIFKGTHIIKCRGFTFPAKAAGMRQMECAFRKAWFSDAHSFIKNNKSKFSRKTAGGSSPRFSWIKARREIFVNKAAEPISV